MDAIVFGAGKFGKNYINILSSLKGDEPKIENLYITRTTMDKAELTAKDFQGRGPNLIPLQVRGTTPCSQSEFYEDLFSIVDRYSIDAAFIPAMDKTKGNNIHIMAAEEFLKTGCKVLVEKPLCDCDDKGKELFDRFSQWTENKGIRENFGMELPFAVLYNAMINDEALYKEMWQAKMIHAHWMVSSNTQELIPNLFPHVDSVRPRFYVPDISSLRVDNWDRANFISFDMYNRHLPDLVEFSTILEYGVMNAYGLKIAGKNFNSLYTFENAKRDGEYFVDMIKHEDCDNLEQALRSKSPEKNVVLSVENPLKQNIIATLKGSPITGYDQTRASQELLIDIMDCKRNFL